MLEEFLALFSKAHKGVMFDEAGKGAPLGYSRKGRVEGKPDNEVLTLSWIDDEVISHVAVLREADIAAGGYNPDRRVFEFFDKRRQPVFIRLENESDEALHPQNEAARRAKHAFPLTMLDEFRRVAQLAWPRGLFIVMGEEAHPVVSSELNMPCGLPGNYILVARTAGEPGERHVVVVTEAGVEAGRFNPERQVFEFLDRYGKPVAIQLRRDGVVVVPEILISPNAKEEGNTVFVVVQEGGTSSELYVQQFASHGDAHGYRVDCWKNGAYRTSPVVEVPRSLADHHEFDDVVQTLLKAVQEVEGVDEEEEA